ncbi:MAG: hypothetical protein V4653_10810 [Pseudomonadota bacterium]
MRKLGIVAALMGAFFTLSACVVAPARGRPIGYYAPAPVVVAPVVVDGHRGRGNAYGHYR